MKEKKCGFTLIETMFALVIATLVIAPLLRLLGTTINRVSQQESRLLDQIALERFLNESRLYANQKENFERQELLNTEKTMFFLRAPFAAEKTDFAQPFLCKERVFIKDKSSKRDFTLELITFYTVLPEKKEKEEKNKEGNATAPTKGTINEKQ